MIEGYILIKSRLQLQMVQFLLVKLSFSGMDFNGIKNCVYSLVAELGEALGEISCWGELLHSHSRTANTSWVYLS